MEIETEVAQEEEIKETGCCPKFNSEPWDEKEIVWENKMFIEDQVNSFLHVPLNYGRIMKRNTEKIEKNNLEIVDGLILNDEYSLWASDIYFCVNGEIPGADNVKLSGTFLTKVFEGPYKDARKWAKEMETFVQGKEIKKLYFWYTTCPGCAKVYKKNYVVLFAQID